MCIFANKHICTAFRVTKTYISLALLLVEIIMSAAHVGPHNAPYAYFTLLPELVQENGSGTAPQTPPPPIVSGAADDQDDELGTRYLTFSAELAPMLQELLMEYSLFEVVVSDADNIELREHVQREVDRQTTFVMQCVTDFAGGVTTTVEVHARAVIDMSSELHYTIEHEIPQGVDIAPLYHYLQQVHDGPTHVLEEHHTGSVPPAQFAGLVHHVEENRADVLMYTSATSGHGHVSHEGSRVALLWMIHVQQMQRGDWILRQMHELCLHAQRIQKRVQQQFGTNSQNSAFCIRTQEAYANVIGVLLQRTRTSESGIVPTISVVVRFSVVCIFMQCGMNTHNESPGGMSPANRQAIHSAFQAGMHVFQQTIEQNIHAPLQLFEHALSPPHAQSDDFHGKADEIWQSAHALVTFCEDECLGEHNMTFEQILQKIVVFTQSEADERRSVAQPSVASDNGTHAGGRGQIAGGDEQGSGGRGGTVNKFPMYCSFTTEMVQCMQRNHVLEHIRTNHWVPIDTTM